MQCKCRHFQSAWQSRHRQTSMRCLLVLTRLLQLSTGTAKWTLLVSLVSGDSWNGLNNGLRIYRNISNEFYMCSTLMYVVHVTRKSFQRLTGWCIKTGTCTVCIDRAIGQLWKQLAVIIAVKDGRVEHSNTLTSILQCLWLIVSKTVWLIDSITLFHFLCTTH